MTRRLLTIVFAAVTLAASACGGSSSSSGAATPAPSEAAKTASFQESEFKIEPSTMTLKPGTYTISLQNTGSFPHDLHIATSDGSEVAHSDRMAPKASTTFEATLQKGTYTIWCAVGNHRAQGMEGKITVQ